MTATVRYAMPRKAQPAEKVPRVARLLALAHKFQGMLDRGEVASMADLARVGRVSRARITQIMDLLMLAPEIQEEVLGARRGTDSLAPLLRSLVSLAHRTSWHEQREGWKRHALGYRQMALGRGRCQ